MYAVVRIFKNKKDVKVFYSEVKALNCLEDDWKAFCLKNDTAASGRDDYRAWAKTVLGEPALWFIEYAEIMDEPSHICKYCGQETEGPDEDVLCDDCREIFGHTYFSEL